MKHIALLFAWSMVAAAIASAPETHLAIENAAVHQYEDGPTVPLDQPFFQPLTFRARLVSFALMENRISFQHRMWGRRGSGT